MIREKGNRSLRLVLLLLGIFIFNSGIIFAAPIKCSYVGWNADSIALHKISSDDNTKTIPDSIYVQACIALSFFPELKDLKIIFQFTSGGAALETMPSFWSILKKPKNRTYFISISRKTAELFEPILFKNLTYDAQIGVLAHELSHVSDFQHYNFWNFVVHALKYTINGSYGDKFEYNTDMICIQHGVGYQLLAWSTDTRQKLDIKKIMEKYKFDMSRERYMRPESIKKAIENLPLYKIPNTTELCY